MSVTVKLVANLWQSQRGFDGVINVSGVVVVVRMVTESALLREDL
jgi:hypothetical protein